MRRRLLLVSALATAFLAAGCDGEEPVRAYSVAKEPSPAPLPSAPAGEIQPPSWTIPAGWRESPEPQPMRVATFLAGEEDAAIEIAVSVFPGDTGGLLANVNRWRGQVGLGPIAEAQVSGIVEPFENSGFTGHLMRLEGPEQHLLGAAIYETAMDRTWFVKAQGSPATADAHAAEVFAFARSFGAGRQGTP